jgi:kynurenine formamidase
VSPSGQPPSLGGFLKTTGMSGTASVDDASLASLFSRLSNWGRWGPDDQRGTLNLLTADAVRAAAALVRTGVRMSCARPLKIGGSSGPGTEFLHHMLISGQDAPTEGLAAPADWFAMGCHGYEYTHIDSPAHILWNGTMYNGIPASQVTVTRGALSGSVDEAANGIAGRGVFVDGPVWKGKPWLDPGEAITADDLDGWCERTGVDPAAGDILVVRVGRDEADRGMVNLLGDSSPGLSLDCLDWMKARDIAVLMTDVISDVTPPPTPGCRLPVHTVAIASMGMWLVDNASLGSLAAACATAERYSFFLTMAPLLLRRSTGSPLNPIAIF